MPHGLLNLDKPGAMTSRQAVNLVQRLVRPLKVGHAGTLDPLATGVLVVCVGAATRLIECVQAMRKRYVGTFLLGRHSPTEDIEGEVTLLENPKIPTREEIDAAAQSLLGRIEQRPPAFSALKVGGRRAYDLARKGEHVDLAPRPITVYSLQLARYDYPELVLDIECSGGTYVRSLGRDLAQRAGTAAVMSALVRRAVGRFRVEEAVDPRLLTPDNWGEHVQPMATAVDLLPKVLLTPEEVARIRTGLTIARQPAGSESSEVAALDAAGQLVAILRPRGPGLLGPLRNLVTD